MPIKKYFYGGGRWRAAADAPLSRNGRSTLTLLGGDLLSAIELDSTVLNVRLKEHLFEPNQKLSHVYFVHSGLISMILHTSDGRSAEIGLLGAEDFVGLPVVLGGASSTAEAVVQAPATVRRIGVELFKRRMHELPRLRAAMLHYALRQYEEATQLAVCNAYHTLHHRFARWLLMAADRLGRESFFMTQEFLAIMLAVQRPAVTVVAQQFQRAGLIYYNRGQINILNRPGLVEVACECYGLIRHGRLHP